MKCNPFYPTKWVGLDIKPQALRLIAARRIKDKLLIENVIYAPFQTDIYLGEKYIKRFDVLANLLAEQVQDQGLQGLPAIVYISAELVHMAHIELPIDLSIEALKTEIHHYLADDFIEQKDDITFDFSVLAHHDPQMVNVHFVVTRQSYIKQLTECIKMAELNLKVIDVDIYCLKRILPIHADSQRHLINACIYIHAGLMMIIFCNATEIIFNQHGAITTTAAGIALIEQAINCGLNSIKPYAIANWYICCNENYQQFILEAALLESEIINWINLQDIFTLTANADRQCFSKDEAGFALACGALRRSIPSW